MGGVNGVSYDLWVGLWQKAFCENPIQTFHFLTYVGFTGKMSQVIQPVRIGVREVLNPAAQHKRHLFHCFVIGATRSNKSALLDSIVAKQENNM